MFATMEEAIVFAVEGSGYRSPDFEPRVQTSKVKTPVGADHRALILAALGAYPRREQEIIIYWSMGDSYRKIAQRLEINDRTVRRIWERVYEPLAKRLEELELVER